MSDVTPWNKLLDKGGIVAWGRWVMASRRRLAGVSVFVIVAAAGLYSLRSAQHADPTGEGAAIPTAVVVAQGQTGYVVAEKHAGTIAARRLSALGFARGGLLRVVEASEGDRVAAGQVLARLDTRALEAKAAELRSALAESRNRLEVANVLREQTASVENRSSALARKDWVSKKAHDDTVYDHRKAVAERAAAESAVRHAEAGLASLQVELDQSVLVAPYAGTIVARRVDEGAAITAGEPVLDLIESEAVEFRVGVPERTAAGLKEGTSYPVLINGVETSCRLLRLLPQVESSTRTVTAIFAVPSMNAPPLSGTLGHLVTRRSLDLPGFWLPLSALTDSRRGLWAVYVVEADNTASDATTGVLSRRDVQLVHVDQDRVYVSGTLRDGERVVVDGLHRLGPGMRVQTVLATADSRILR
ncbi:MAG: efflux RND transporter periplasmic adaptor subunit [Magnetospirillum sp.]